MSKYIILFMFFNYRMVHVIAMEVLPDERDRKYYADNYSCCPPPLFVILVTILEVSFFFALFLDRNLMFIVILCSFWRIPINH